MSDLTVISGGVSRRLGFDPPVRLLDLLREHNIPVYAPCGGHGKCCQCSVAATGDLSTPDAFEMEHARDGMRYACRAVANGDITIISNEQADASIQIEGVTPPFAVQNDAAGLGAAVDIGTTTVAAYLYDMTTGERLGAASALNPQASFGADVISRIQASMDGHDGELAHSICACIAGIITTLLDDHYNMKERYAFPGFGSVSYADTFRRKSMDDTCPDYREHHPLTRVVLTGNTAMLTLLCGLPAKPLAAMPFRAEHLFGEYRQPKALSLPHNASIYLPACAGAYVGADITTAMLAGGLYAGGKVYDGPPLMLVDIGTNGEIALAARGELTCCATAAGPAFEGAGISCGMLAEPGAIDTVDYVDGGMIFSTISGVAARGICGTGLVDLAAALLDAGLLDDTGYLEDGEYTFPGTDVTITGKDIRSLQLAKAAIRAGMITLLRETGCSVNDVQTLVIAGGFGSKIRPSSAERIGLLPRGFARKSVSIGNGAGMGAAMALLSDSIRADSESIGGQARVIELSSNPIFMDEYVEGMMFET